MLIKIDTRESDLHLECLQRTCNNDNIRIESEMLPLGDIILYNDNGDELVIIERKTLYDLASSIKDGRYKEQSYRLHECSTHNHNIIYLVEGNLQSYNPNRGRLERKSILSAFVTITYFKGFVLHRTEGLSETAEWIVNYAVKLQNENRKAFYDNIGGSSSDEIGTAQSYVSVSSRVKKSKVTYDNIGAIMLSQIPGVSTAVSIAVMEKYGTLKELMRVLSNDPCALDEITISNKSNKPRKISKTSCQNIYNYLIYCENTTIEISTGA